MNISLSTNETIVLLTVIIWDLLWRGIALWQSGRRNQPVWFIVILIVNSLGILPIIYLLINAGKEDYTERTDSV